MSLGAIAKSSSLLLFLLMSLVACTSEIATNQQVPVDEQPVSSNPRSMEATSPVEWSSQERSSQFVTMPDGVKLAVDIHLPSGYMGEGDAPSKFPIILLYTPYHRSEIDLVTGEVRMAPRETTIPFWIFGRLLVAISSQVMAVNGVFLELKNYWKLNL